MTDSIRRVFRAPHNSAKSNPWYVSPRPNPAAEIRLIFFPFAGGGPSAFIAWLDELPNNIEACFAHYPGRGSRYNEPAIGDFASLVENLSQTVPPLADKPFAFFGHSMGALVAFELTRRLRRNNLPQPTILFISACGAPHVPDPHPPIHTLSDAEFLKSLTQLNGIPSELLHQPDVMQLLLPTLRADFEAIESYHYSPNESPLNCPIIAFGGQDDPRVSQEHLEGWASQTNTNFKTIYFPGDHFFINMNKDAIIAEIKSSHAKR